MQIPEGLLEARKKWKYTGSIRPEFAIVPKKGQISVWDFPRPPQIIRIQEEIKINDGKHLLVKSKKALAILETANPPTYYFPKSDINFEFLTAISSDSWCEWKGHANYYALKSNPEIAVAWEYVEPFKEYQKIRGYLAFYPQNLDCYIGEEKIIPQEGKVYAGWISKNLVGPFKGPLGTENW